MPFVEHRGGGKAHVNVASMESRWDAVWSMQCEADASRMATSEHWASIKRSIPSGRVLEAGCGVARWVAFLDMAGYEAYGLDYSKTAVEKSLALWPNLRVRQGDLRAMPFDSDFFDGVVSFGAVEHDVNGPGDALAEIYRVLRPGGMLYCTVPCMNWLRRTGLLALSDWVVCNRTIRRLAGRGVDVEFFEYVFKPTEYHAAIQGAGFDQVELIPLSPRDTGERRPVRRRVVRIVHQRWPWCLTHMMAAVCRKPQPGTCTLSLISSPRERMWGVSR
jgi:SAM-dependent methyltransferase